MTKMMDPAFAVVMTVMDSAFACRRLTVEIGEVFARRGALSPRPATSMR
jgi:hypothetical protein